MWTKESVEKEIRSQGRTCRGPCVLPVPAQKAVAQSWEVVLGERIWANALAFQSSLEDVLGRGHLDVAENDWELMNRYIRGLWDSRKGCGFDINEVIVAGPLDGEIHAYNCPGCGLNARYIPGVFEGVPALRG